MWLVDLDGAPLELTRSEFDLLLAIMTANRRVISKDALALELRGDYATSGYVSDSDRRAVEVHMANLRRKLNDPVASPALHRDRARRRLPARRLPALTLPLRLSRPRARRRGRPASVPPPG